MKKVCAVILSVAMLLSLAACGAAGTPETTQGTDPGTSAQTQPAGPSLTELRRPVGTDGVLWEIPLEPLRQMNRPELYIYKGELLCCAPAAPTDGPACLDMKMISLETGDVLASASPVCGGAASLQFNDDCIALCDSTAGTVEIFNSRLETQATYHPEQTGGSWYLSTDMQTLYICHYGRGVEALNLLTGETATVIGNARDLVICGSGREYVVFSWLDLESQKFVCRCLDLQTGALQEIPFAGTVSAVFRSGENWLICEQDYYTWHLITAEGGFACEAAVLSLPLSGEHILQMDYDTGSMCLYDLQGRFVSRCAMPAGMVVSDPVWSDTLNGYCFLDRTEGRLLLWDPSVSVQGAPLTPLPEEQRPEGETAEEALYERARELSERYEVDIRIADECQLEYTNYSSYAVSDEALLTTALDTLEEALAAYPEGFMAQLQFGDIRSIRIELVGGVSAHPGVTGAAAFASRQKDNYLIVADVFFLDTEKLYHEITHIIDQRLAWDAALRPDALFSEETWMTLQPEGFEYAYSYLEIPQQVQAFAASGYFAEDYALTFPTEDRATMMECAMAQSGAVFDFNPGLLPKLEYYAQCLRDCFNTALWPETTPWERVLSTAN